jgi:hypothetical protein
MQLGRRSGGRGTAALCASIAAALTLDPRAQLTRP